MNETDCRRLRKHLSAFLDGEAQTSICPQIEAHMSDCPDCRVVVDTLRKTISLYRETEKQRNLPTEVRRRLFRSLRLEEFLRDQGPTTMPPAHDP